MVYSALFLSLSLLISAGKTLVDLFLHEKMVVDRYYSKFIKKNNIKNEIFNLKHPNSFLIAPRYELSESINT